MDIYLTIVLTFFCMEEFGIKHFNILIQCYVKTGGKRIYFAPMCFDSYLLLGNSIYFVSRIYALFCSK